LATAVKEKSFREDLFYRLNVINITIPPLRERIEDVPLLTRHFIDKFNKKLGRNVRKISTSTMNALMKYDWPGNIRELQNAIERAVAVADADEIIFNYNSFKSSNTDGQSSDRKGTGVEDEIDLLTIDIFGSSNQQPPSIEEVEREYILKILNLTGQNKLKASKILGIDTSTLWRKLKKIEGN
jgi:transcriptional regulator with PAS, ATPase and Fis domain